MNWIPTIPWWTLLDVVLVALLAWQLIALLRRTRAAWMVLGAVVILIGLVLLGSDGRLPMISWAADHLAPYALITLLILFQPEIRELLARLGRAISFAGRGDEAEAYDDIVMAAGYFSQERTGALMVIERKEGLRQYVESGVPMDARLSYDLLTTIFRPTAPLHDGAVIIQKDRIAAAACFLPLSLNPVLSNQVGTRHRAALGITEETDAIAIVVSEETGQISLVLNGDIHRGLTVEELRSKLSKILQSYVPPTPMPTPIAQSEDSSALGGKRTL